MEPSEMMNITQISAPGDIAAVRDLVREFTDWAFAQDPDAISAPTFANLETELASLPGVYGPPTGCFLLARDGGEPAGCVAFRADGPDTVEVKRMYVRPNHRGKGIGQALVASLIAEARRQNIRRIVLSTHCSLVSAQRIYRASGFRVVPPPADFPEQFRARVVFMEMGLG
jgi:GNAT superfamily N-acetyltransferase